MAVLLISARRSGLAVTRVLAFLVAGVTFLHGLFTAVDTGTIVAGDPDFTARVFQYGLTVFAFLAAAQLYERTSWTTRSPLRLPVTDGTLDLLWSLDLVSEPSTTKVPARKPFDGLLFPYLYALTGVFLYIVFAFMVTQEGSRFAAYGIGAFVLIIGGRALSSPALVVSGLLPVAVAFVAGSVEAFDSEASYTRLLAGAIPLGLLGWLAEPRIVGRHRSFAAVQTTPMAFLLHGTAAWITALFLIQMHDASAQLLLIAAIAIYYAAISFLVTPVATAYIATAALVAAHILWLPYSADREGSFHLVTWTLVALSLVGDRIFSMRGHTGAGPVLILSCIAVLIRYAYVSAGQEWAPVAWVAVAVAAAGYGALARSWAAFAGAVAAGILASAQQLANSYPIPPDTDVLVLGFIATAALWILGERTASRIGSENADAPKGICVTAATILLLCLLERSPALREFYLTISWSILGFALFGVALAFHEKYYRYAGLAVILLASGRVLTIDTVNLEPMPRILAWFVLGLVMLVLGFGYVKAFPAARTTPDRDGEL
jgi:hypothetical protein